MLPIEMAAIAKNADMAKLADALDLGSSAARHVGSTPIIRTTHKFPSANTEGFFLKIKLLKS